MSPPSRTLRLVSFSEGLSLLALVLVAMPLKYALGMPMAVRVVGLIHGFLFLALLSLVAQAVWEPTLPKRRAALVLGLSLVPFGFVFADRILRPATDEPATAK